MRTRNINLTKAQDDFIRQLVEDGEFKNSSEAIRAALDHLQHRTEEQERRLASLRAEVKRVACQMSTRHRAEINPDSNPIGLRDPVCGVPASPIDDRTER